MRKCTFHSHYSQFSIQAFTSSRIEYYTVQHTCITQYRRHSTQYRWDPPSWCSCLWPPFLLVARVRMSGCRIVGLYLAVSCEARRGNCSQFRSISVKGPGAVTPGAWVPSGMTLSLSPWPCQQRVTCHHQVSIIGHILGTGSVHIS